MTYTYVPISNKYMRAAYEVAKGFYNVKKWNKKTTPVCLLVKNGKVLSVGVSGGGMHAILGKCDREDRPGSPYSDCRHCEESQHAEMRALSELKNDPKGAKCYLYGHFHACKTCVARMAEMGIEEVVLLRWAKILFDRHEPGTVIGTPRQFDR